MKLETMYRHRNRTRSTGRLLFSLVLSMALLGGIIALTSCGIPIEDATPLDRLGDNKSAAELHEENVQAITSNPGYRLP
jgi:hypothetical protein